MGDSVQVDPVALFTYGGTLATNVGQAEGQLSDAFVGIGQHAQSAFATKPPGTIPFAEGLTAVAYNNRNMSDFQAFLKDVGIGLQAITSAATSMAVVYATTDEEQADSVNAVDFAFAGGSGAPAGFPKDGVSTMHDQQLAYDDAAGRNTTAAAAADNPDMLQYATSQQPVPGGFVYTFADGSRLQITNATGQSMYRSDTSKTVSIYKPGSDKPAMIVTTGDSTDYSGQPTKSKTTQTMTSDGKYITSSESTTTLSGGTVSVTTSTTDTNGQTQITETKIDPPKKTAPDPSTLGEIEKRQQQYHTQGSTEGMQYGRN
ncbi:hypothetical protein [Dactylosporangium sp. NPDC048998]|uniref:hypothetical protein n=1 Tax=Dactylosporangium sp. NPDC048998 TaxID=3363976 RepID=UPI0037137C98